MKFRITEKKKNLIRKQRWHFSIVADNGEVLAQSENYHNNQDMLDTIALLKAKLASARIVYENPK